MANSHLDLVSKVTRYYILYSITYKIHILSYTHFGLVSKETRYLDLVIKVTIPSHLPLDLVVLLPVR